MHERTEDEWKALIESLSNLKRDDPSLPVIKEMRTNLANQTDRRKRFYIATEAMGRLLKAAGKSLIYGQNIEPETFAQEWERRKKEVSELINRLEKAQK